MWWQIQLLVVWAMCPLAFEVHEYVLPVIVVVQLTSAANQIIRWILVLISVAAISVGQPHRHPAALTICVYCLSSSLHS